MHLPDVFVVKPVFVDGVIVGYAGTLGHQSDIGGIAPGSMALYATEIYQEGLRIPLMKLYDAGEPNRTLFQLLEKNVRVAGRGAGRHRRAGGGVRELRAGARAAR